MELNYTVSAKHVAPAYALDKATVTVKSNDNGKTWYCYMPKFGCSKSYTKPESAIREMLMDHACTHIFINRVL